MIYTVVVASNDFTCFIGRKSFWFYKNAKKFADNKYEFFDAIWIEKFGKNIEDVKTLMK